MNIRIAAFLLHCVIGIFGGLLIGNSESLNVWHLLLFGTLLSIHTVMIDEVLIARGLRREREREACMRRHPAGKAFI